MIYNDNTVIFRVAAYGTYDAGWIIWKYWHACLPTTKMWKFIEKTQPHQIWQKVNVWSQFGTEKGLFELVEKAPLAFGQEWGGGLQQEGKLPCSTASYYKLIPQKYLLHMPKLIYSRITTLRCVHHLILAVSSSSFPFDSSNITCLGLMPLCMFIMILKGSSPVWQ